MLAFRPVCRGACGSQVRVLEEESLKGCGWEVCGSAGFRLVAPEAGA
ncbi:hypothetical protein [Nonomuraea sp. NPDC050643]